MAGSFFPDDPANALSKSQLGASSFFPPASPTDSLGRIVPDAAKKNPAQTAKIFQLQTKTGLPADLIERNLDYIETEANRRDFNADAFRKQSPLLAKWLVENPKHAALANDDLANLGALEWIVTAPQRAWKQGWAQVEAGFLASRLAVNGSLTEAEHKRLAELDTEMARGGDLAAESWFGNALTGGARQLPMLFTGMLEGAKTGLPASMGAATAAAVAGQMGPQVALPEEIATVPAAALTGYYIGQTAGSARFGFQQESGHAYLEFRKFKDELGRPLDDGVARIAAIAAGAINAPIEAFQMNTILRSIPGADRLAGEATRSAVRQALASPTVRGALKGLALNYGKVLTTETMTEVAQRAVTILSGELGKVASGQDIKPKTAGEIAADLGDEAVSSAQAFTFLSLPGPAMRAGRDTMRAREAAKNEAFFTALGEGVNQSKTFKRLPEKVQEFVARATKDGPIENVYVDADTFTQYWQSKGLPAAQVAEEIGIDREAFEQAAAAGQKIAIPTATYATKIAPTEHNAFFAAEMRLGPDEMNAREAREYQTELEQRAQQETVVDEGQRTAYQSAAKIREDVIGQLLALGYDRGAAEAQAAQMEAAFRTMAVNASGDNIKFDPMALYERYKLGVNRPMPDILRQRSNVDQFDALLDRLRSGQIPQQGEIFGPSLVEFLRSKGGVQDEGGELRGRDPDKSLKPFQRKLINEQGMSLDDALTAAREAGYLNMADENSVDQMGINNLLDAIDEDLRGNPIFSNRNENSGKLKLAQALEALDKHLNDIGIDLNAMTNEQIKAALNEASQNQERQVGDVEFDPVSGNILYQGDVRELIIQHNMTEDNLLHAVRMGGIPVPSLAITKSADSMTNFGEITLIGDKALADPKGYARTRVFGADIYSPRYPEISYKLDNAALKKLNELLAPYRHKGEREIYGGEVSKPRELNGIKAFDRYVDENFSDKKTGYRDIDAAATKLLRESGSDEKIFMGFTYSGNRRYIPHTLENVVKILKKELRGGESSGNLYGVGQLRSRFTPQFRAVKQIRDNKEKIVSKGQFESVKDEVNSEFFQIVEAVRPFYKHSDSNRFGFPDTVMALIEDSAKMGLNRAASKYGFNELGDEVRQDIYKFVTRLRNMPTEYFEAKVLREVGIHEFAVAVIPNDANEDVRTALAKRGLDVVEYKRGDEADRKRAVNEAAQAAAERVLFQQSGSMSDKRGAIRFGEDRQTNIDLFEKANLSTFLHESGHFYLEVMGDVIDELLASDAELNETQQRMIDDYEKLLKWLGVQSRDQIGVEQHEQWARGIEAYFMEGKAPSSELRHIFARFSEWLVRIYDSLTKLNVQLSDEVRGVMDRMFATEQEIEAAEREAHVDAMFTDAKSAGMTDAEFKAYRETVQSASDSAKAELQAKLMRTIQRERQAWWKKERDAMRAAIAVDVYQQREYIALSVLQKGKMPDGSELPEGIPAFKLDRAALVDVYGQEFLKRLPRPYVYAAKDGISPDAAADLLGFKSGDELVMAIVNARPMNKLIDAETDARMREQYPDPLTDGTVAEQARAAVHNDERSKVIHAEMRALAKKRREVAPFVQAERDRAEREANYAARWADAERKLAVAIQKGEDQAIIDRLNSELKSLKAHSRHGAAMLISGVPPIDVFRNIARGRVDQMMVRDIRPGQYLVAARKASRLATDAAAKQDYDTAVIQKQRELLNVELYRAATKARDDADSAVSYMRKFGETKTRARIGKSGQDYLDQIDALLGRFSFARISLKAAERRAALAQWIAQKERDGQTVDLPDDVVNEAYRKDWREMTYIELTGLRDSVRHIEHLARLKNKLLTAKKNLDLAAAVDEITTSINDNAKSTKGRRIETRLPKDEAARQVEGFFASLRKLSSLLREMDGFKDAGPLWEYLMRPINEAGNREAVMNAEAMEKLSEIFSAYKGKDAVALYHKTHIPAINMPLTKMGRIMVAMNWGNADSRQKLMDGYGWNESQVQSILDTLDERDWNFVQSVFDFVNSYWPQIEAKEKRVNGIAPDKVQAVAIDTPFGQFEGGYFPLKYDDRQSAKAASHEVKEIADQMTRGAVARSTTKRGHTKARVEGVKMPVRLDFGVLFEHTNQIIHDLTHHEMLIDAGRILGSKEVQDAIYGAYGDVTYDQIKKAMQDIAAGDIGAQTFYERGMNHLRTGTTVAFMGWSVMTALQQPFGLTQSMSRIGIKWVGRGLSRWMRDAASMESTAAWITEKSDMMRLRSRTQMREINEIRNQIGLSGGRISGWIDEALSHVTDKNVRVAIADSYFWLIYKGQQIADIPTWVGAYEKAMADNHDEATSIALADQAVLDAQGGGQIKDLAGIQRGGPLLKLWTNFYSYFNVTWNNTVESTKRTNFRDPVSVGRLAVDYLLLYALPATLAALMKEAIKGGDDDEDKLFAKLVRENLSYMAGTLVGLREIGGALQGYAGYEGPAGARFFAAIGKFIKQAQQGEIDSAFLRSINEAAGIVLHYPAGQARRTIEGAAALWEGKTSNPLVLLSGPPKN